MDDINSISSVISSHPPLRAITWIHLKHRQDRYTKLVQNWLSPPPPLPLYCFITPAIKKSEGFMGCIESHIKALHKMKRQLYRPDDWVCVMEDDAKGLLPSDALLTQIPAAASVVLLGCTPVELYLAPASSCIKRVRRALCMVAALIRVRYLDTLLHYYEEALYKRIPLDLLCQTHQEVDHWYAIWPPLISQQPSYSDIEQKDVDYSPWDVQGLQLRWI